MSRSTMLRTAVAVVAVLALGATATAVVTSDKSSESTVVGYFTDASPLTPGSQVRAAGVKVGTVEHITLENGKARVTLEVNPSVVPLHRDARLKIRPVNLLGEQYIELDPGSPGQPFMEQHVVPASRTESSVRLQDVLNTFDDPTSTALAALITTLGEGMQDSGAEAAAAIKALAPAMRRAEDVGKVLREQNGVLNELVDRVQPVAKALAAKDGKTLDRLVASTERTLSTLATNQRAVEATLRELPATLTEARRTLRELTGAARATTPTLKSIRPITDNLTEITKELQRFADAADPALASLRPVLKRADQLLKQAAPVAEQLRKAGPDLQATANDLRPLGDQLLNKHLGDLMAFVKKWSLSTNGRDALSHYFRGVAFVTPKTLQDLASSILPGKNKSSGGKPETPMNPGKLLPDPGKSIPNLGKKLPEVLPDGPSGPDPGNATGLTPKQEQSMLDQLLGGT